MKGSNYMNKIREFFNEQFGTVRTVNLDGRIYFVGIDIAKALGYVNASKAISTHCKKAFKTEIDVSSQNGNAHKARKSQHMLVISKSDIYRLIVKSKLDSADDFESWVFDDILPRIESTGAYIEQGREEEMIEKYFPSFSEDTKKDMVKDLIKQNMELKEFYDTLMSTEGLMDINTMAKELGIGEYKLFAFLRDKKVFFYNKDMINIPYERFRKEGKFKVKESPCRDGNIRSTTYATKKGLEYVRKLLKKNDYYPNPVTE